MAVQELREAAHACSICEARQLQASAGMPLFARTQIQRTLQAPMPAHDIGSLACAALCVNMPPRHPSPPTA